MPIAISGFIGCDFRSFEVRNHPIHRIALSTSIGYLKYIVSIQVGSIYIEEEVFVITVLIESYLSLPWYFFRYQSIGKRSGSSLRNNCHVIFIATTTKAYSFRLSQSPSKFFFGNHYSTIKSTTTKFRTRIEHTYYTEFSFSFSFNCRNGCSWSIEQITCILSLFPLTCSLVKTFYIKSCPSSCVAFSYTFYFRKTIIFKSY